MSFLRFVPVTDLTDPLTLSIGISGGSGTGKTYSALRVARGIAQEIAGKGGRIGFIDTENRRALHYRDAFPEMVHADFSAVNDAGDVVGFGPERWIEAIDAAEAADLPALVIDSFSHGWAGVGGVLECQARELDRLVEEAEKRAAGRYAVDPEKFNMLSWAAVKPRYRRLVDRLIRAKTHVVVCTRAKPVIQKGFGDKAANAFKVKHRRTDIPWNPETDGDLMFEMTAMVILDPSKPGCPVHQIKVADQFRSILDPDQPMTEATGREMARWAKGEGDHAKRKAMLDAAREAARGGTDAFTAWWKQLPVEMRTLVNTISADCKRLASEADARAAATDQPFGPDPTPDEIARAMADAKAAADAEAASA